MNEITDEKVKIDHLKRIIDNLNKHWHSIQLLLSHVSKPLLVDDRGLANVLTGVRQTFTELFVKLNETKESLEKLDIVQTLNEIKYIGKRLYQIELDISEIKNNGIRKNVHLDITLDGENMSTKNMEMHQDPLNKILDNLTEREKLAIIHRFGLFGKRPQTYIGMSKIIGISKERCSFLVKKSLRKLRNPLIRTLVKKIPHTDLKKEILGSIEE